VAFLRFLRKQINLVWSHSVSRRLFIFILLLYLFLSFELVYGYFTSSLALIALAVYTSSNSIALFVSLVSMVSLKHSPTRTYSYGFQRLEIVFGFTDGVVHTIAAGFIIVEAIEHIITESEAPEFSSFRAVVVVLIGFALNLIGCLIFHSHKLMHSTGEMRVRGNEEYGGMFWNLAANGGTALITVFSIVLVGWDAPIADNISAVLICVAQIASSYPLARNTGRVLLQATPASIRDRLHKTLSEVPGIDGVLECTNDHFWTHAPGEYVGSFHIRVRPETDEQVVLAKVYNLFSGFITSLTIQVEKDNLTTWPLSPSDDHSHS